jgi:hypothetical protein
MVQLPRRTTIRGPTFIRLLARLTDVDVHPPKPLLSHRLSEWLDLNHAIALSTALEGRPSVTTSDVPPAGGAGEVECARVRATLVEAIAGDRAFNAAGSSETVDYAFFRQRHLALQQTMDTSISQLRGRLRDLLALGTADMARLAAVDAAMERALSRREWTLLSRVPALLGQHFERLREAAQEAQDGTQQDTPASEDTATPAPSAWLDTFRKDMQGALLAELDVRLQPIEGLLAALRTHFKGHNPLHVQETA